MQKVNKAKMLPIKATVAESGTLVEIACVGVSPRMASIGKLDLHF